MKAIRESLRLVLMLAVLVLPACAPAGYRAHVQGWGTYPYYGWYDGFYGPIYDGYWGSDGYFYYRRNDHDRVYHRDDREHFRRGEHRPDRDYHRIEGRTHRPPPDARMPNFPHRRDQNDDRRRDRDRNDDRDH